VDDGAAHHRHRGISCRDASQGRQSAEIVVEMWGR
jgi:hypothetical protein